MTKSDIIEATNSEGIIIEFLKELQEALIETLFGLDCVERAGNEQFKRADGYLVKLRDEIIKCKVEP